MLSKIKKFSSIENQCLSLQDKRMAGDGRCRLLVKNVNPITSLESLQNYFEVMAKEDVDGYVLFNIDRTLALVTMERKPGKIFGLIF